MLQRKKQDAMRRFAQLGDLVKSKHILVSSDLVDVEKIDKININPSTLEEGEESLVEL